MVEFHLARYDKMTSPPLHLQHRRITSVMESFGRERRLRAFGVVAYRELLARNNEPINDTIYPPTPRQAGRFAEISHLPFYPDNKTFDKRIDQIGPPTRGVNVSDFEKKETKTKVKRPRSATPNETGDIDADIEIIEVDQLAQVGPRPQKPQKKVPKTAGYGQESQVRGRPRKYIHVVGLDGKVERTIIGSVLPHPDLAPIWIYVPRLDKLVPANASYSGIGEPSEPDEQELQQARTPESFTKYRRAKDAKPPNMTRRNALMKSAAVPKKTKRKQSAKEEDDAGADDAGEDAAGEDDARRSKRARPVKPVEVVVEPISDEDDFAIVEQHEVAAPPTADNAPVAGPSRSERTPQLPLPRSDITPSQDPVGPIEETAAQVDLDQPRPMNPQDDPSDHDLDSVLLEDPIVDHVQIPEGDFGPLSRNTSVGRSAQVTGSIESPAERTAEVPRQVSIPGQQGGSTVSQSPLSPRPVSNSQAPSGAGDPRPLHTSKQSSPVPRQASPAPSHSSPVPIPSASSSRARSGASTVMAIVRESRSPSLREMSHPLLPVVADAAVEPATPTYNHQAPQPQYYTPPGVQSYAILPPVVYVPPGYTVWPPLPPGYPTTDVPPPHHQASPYGVPAMPMPGVGSPGTQQQPYNPQYQLPQGSYHESPMSPTRTSHMDTPSRRGINSGSSSMGPSPRERRPNRPPSGRGSPSAPDASLGTGSSSSLPQTPPVSNDPATATPATTVPSSRNPIARLQSGEIGTQPVSPLTPAGATSSRRPALGTGNSTQSTSVPEVMPAPLSTPDAGSPQHTPIPTTPMAERHVHERPSSPPDVTTDAPTEMEASGSEAPVASSQADISSTMTLHSLELTPIRAPKKARKGRMDLGVMRRANEMLTVLQEAGGVYEEHALWRLHQEWSFRVAGTDAPYAPSIGATMDRQVWKRLMQSTKDDGRTSDTISVVPTSTAAWRNYRIIWLIDTPKEKVDEYMRGLANTIKKVTAPKQIISTQLPHMQYTEVKLPSRHPSSTVQHQISEVVDEECRGLTGDERRNALCKDPLVLSQLYGRQSGKWARTNLFHVSIRNTVQNAKSNSILDRSAGVFMSPMMSQNIPIGTFYAVVVTHERDEALLEWLKSPINRATPVKDVPYDIRIHHDQRRQRTHTRIREHVNMLLALGLISPLSISSEAEAYVTVNTPQMPNASLKIDTKEVTGEAVTYVIHDWAPIYHIAGQVPSLLGYLPVRTEEEINAYWDTYRMACSEMFSERLPDLTPRSSVESRNIADSPEILNISSGWKHTMRQAHRWGNAVRLLPVQRDALNETVNWTEATSNLKSADQLAALAWEFALPEEAVKTHYETRLQKAIEAKSKRERRTQAMDEALSARHAKAQRALAFKLSERQAQSKRTWEDRVAGICAHLMVHFDHALLDHVSRQSLTSMSKGFLTNEMIERIIRQYFSQRLIQSVKNNMPPPSMPLQAIPIVRAKGPKSLAAKDRQYRRESKSTSTLMIAPGTRYRRKWSAEDDELLVDAEAIIRARNRDRPHNQRTKIGAERMFPGSQLVSCQSRLKKTINTPEKEIYITLLEQAWYDISMDHRDELQDEHPEHNNDFDIRAYIEFLRKHVNKTEMYVTIRYMS